ncbi:Atxe2 family lasso peptide isopeptidase, partial [Sphingobium sp.]|uniref:Atxe2 family lasso peptide isopeptidase n=1 Tax=Sphingobium sp. TaxID=1912891 RepID=UPI002B537A99
TAWLGYAFLACVNVQAQVQSRDAAPCSLSIEEPQAAVTRAVTWRDILGLRDFGALGLSNSPEPFSVSPAGDIAALQLREADVENDRYCTAVVLVDLSRRRAPTVIDNGGEIVAASSTRYGMSDLPLGIPKPALLRWSPDGRHLAYTKTFDDHSEIWTYDRSNRHVRRVVTSAADILDMAWSQDGRRLLYSSQPGLLDARAAIAAEGNDGYRYGPRFWPLSSDKPMPSDVPVVDSAWDVEAGAQTPLTQQDPGVLHPSLAWPSGAGTAAFAASTALVAWTVPQSTDLDAVTELRIKWPGGEETPCPFPACRNVTGLWWAPDGKRLIFQRQSGPAESRTEFYSWSLGTQAPRRLLDTPDALFGCASAGLELRCAQETSGRPRRLIALDVRSGKRREVFDPNPAFSSLRVGNLRRLVWSNAFGLETFGDLVLPPGWSPGKRLPLVVVQYESRGFLRGGTGDEYPIQAMAAQGLAVLSFNRPTWYGMTRHPKSDEEFYAFNNENFADRRSNLSSLAEIIGKLDREGIIDPARIAITGQSDGAVTATFALANSSLFSAAILSTCCESEPAQVASGLALDEFYVSMGYPATRATGADFWRINSLVDAPGAKKVPILVQAASSEFRMALATYRELHRKNWPIEMYVYPDEGHVKLHPAHRAAVYSRNLAWLREHLQDQ